MLLERDEDLARVAAAIGEPGRVLVVEGEAGMGKTSLLDAAVHLARDTGATVLTARGGELERGFGHGVARQLFEARLRAASAAERRRWLAGAAGLAAPALGLDAARGGGMVDDPAFAAQHGLYWLAANLAAEGPLVLVVDDLHWVDLASLRWLVYLARRLEGLDLVLLGGWRLGEPDAPRELFHALHGERLALRPLSVAAAALMVVAELGRDCDPQSAEACHHATHGNPLLLSQLAQTLSTTTRLPLDAARIASLGARAAAPHVRARLRLLEPAAAAVAEAAAVLDGHVTTRELAALTGLTLEAVREACDLLVRARLLSGRHTFEFVHPLVRAAVYEAIDPARRAAAHRIAADLLDADGATDRAAVHLVVAERSGDADLVVRLVTAAERAATRGAIDEAVTLLTRALEEPPPHAARFEILMSLSHAEWLARDEAGVDHARAALALADGPEQHEASATRAALLLSPAGCQQAAVDVLASAADALRDTAPERAQRLDVERVSWSLMLPRAPRGTTALALSLVGQVEPDSLHGRIHGGTIALGAAAAGAVSASVAAQMAPEALADRQMLDDLNVTAPFHWPLNALGCCERLDDYEHWVELRRERAARSGSRIEPPVLAAHRARIAWLRGELATTLQEAREALEGTASRGYVFYVPFAAAQLVAALVEQGDLGEARELLAIHGIERGLTFAWGMLLPARIALALAAGDLEGAVAQLAGAPRESASLPLALGPSQVLVALATGAPDEARRHARTMLDAAERFGAPGVLGVARRLLGLATGGDEGVDLLGGAIESLRRSAFRLELARAFVDYGAALRRRTTAPARPQRRRVTHAERAACRAPGGAGALEPRGRAGPLRDARDRRDALALGLSQARPQQPRAARRRARLLTNLHEPHRCEAAAPTRAWLRRCSPNAFHERNASMAQNLTVTSDRPVVLSEADPGTFREAFEVLRLESFSDLAKHGLIPSARTVSSLLATAKTVTSRALAKSGDPSGRPARWSDHERFAIYRASVAGIPPSQASIFWSWPGRFRPRSWSRRAPRRTRGSPRRSRGRSTGSRT